MEPMWIYKINEHSENVKIMKNMFIEIVLVDGETKAEVNKQNKG